MIVAVITGGRDRTPTIAELDECLACLVKWRVTHVRQGWARGTDKSVAAWLRARTDLVIENYPADVHGEWPWCGHKRNRFMLDGDGLGNLFGESLVPPASVLVAFAGGTGTADCVSAAVERGLPVEHIDPVSEPRPWNRHHGDPPTPSTYVGRGSPLGNQWPVRLNPGEERSAAAVRIFGLYERWLWERINPRSPKRDLAVVAALESITAEHHLMCSCWPSHCHAEVIIRAWRWQRGNAPARGSVG